MPKYPFDIKDVIFQKYKGSGPGGQHRNKTETGIRAIHVPTNVRAEVCSERSQSYNKEAAIKLLQSKLDRMAEEKAAQKKKARHQAKPAATFGHQVRTYRMGGPTPTVVDHRTGRVHPNSEAVVKRGELDWALMPSRKPPDTK